MAMLLTLLVQGLCGALSAQSAHAAHSNASTCTANVDVVDLELYAFALELSERQVTKILKRAAHV